MSTATNSQVGNAAMDCTETIAAAIKVKDAFLPLVEKRDTEILALQKDIAEHERLALKFLDAVVDFKKRIGELTADNERYAEMNASQQDGKDKLRATVKKQVTKLTLLEDANDKLQTKNDTQYKTIEEIDVNLAEAEDNHVEAAGQVDELELQIRDMGNTIDELQAEVRNLADELAEKVE